MTLNVGVFGSDGSGRTTFTGLLYMAQVDFSNRTGQKSGFRFFAEPVQIKAMQGIYNQLRSREWPFLPAGVLKISCSYVYSSGGFLSKLFNRAEGNTVVIDIYMVDICHLVGFMEKPIYKKAADNDVFVFLLDASDLPDGPVPADGAFCSFLSRIVEAKRDNSGDNSLDVVFVLTKFDMIDKGVFTDMAISPIHPLISECDKRSEYGEKFMARMCPKTLAFLRDNARAKSLFRSAVYFFSCVNASFDEEGNVVPRMKRVKGSANFELDYTYEEYEGLIKNLAELASGRIS